MKFKFALLIFSLLLVASCTQTKPKTSPGLAIFREILDLKLKDKKDYFQKLGYTFKWGDSTSLTYKHVDDRDTSSYQVYDLGATKGCIYKTNNKGELTLIKNEVIAKGFTPQVGAGKTRAYVKDNELFFVIDTVRLGKRIITLNLMRIVGIKR